MTCVPAFSKEQTWIKDKSISGRNTKYLNHISKKSGGKQMCDINGALEDIIMILENKRKLM